MATIKARDLKVGMYLGAWGTVEEVSAPANGVVNVTFSVHDFDCGEDEFFPMELDLEKVLKY